MTSGINTELNSHDSDNIELRKGGIQCYIGLHEVVQVFLHCGVVTLLEYSI